MCPANCAKLTFVVRLLLSQDKKLLPNKLSHFCIYFAYLDSFLNTLIKIFDWPELCSEQERVRLWFQHEGDGDPREGSSLGAEEG